MTEEDIIRHYDIRGNYCKNRGDGAMQNLYLIGFMGTGKSTVAKVFQEDYHMKLLEMDEEIVRQEKDQFRKYLQQMEKHISGI